MNVNSISPEDIVMIGDIAVRQKVSKATVQRWMKRPGFPDPITELIAGKVYDYGAVVLWLEQDKARRREALEQRLEELS